jgi:hypothetical protein
MAIIHKFYFENYKTTKIETKKCKTIMGMSVSCCLQNNTENFRIITSKNYYFNFIRETSIMWSTWLCTFASIGLYFKIVQLLKFKCQCNIFPCIYNPPLIIIIAILLFCSFLISFVLISDYDDMRKIIAMPSLILPPF